MAKHKSSHPNSSAISDIEYDDATKDMHITFSSGDRHCFKAVGKEDYDALTKAESLGRHFHMHVRRKFESEKVD